MTSLEPRRPTGMLIVNRALAAVRWPLACESPGAALAQQTIVRSPKPQL
jgi:hypothetical protein